MGSTTICRSSTSARAGWIDAFGEFGEFGERDLLRDQVQRSMTPDTRSLAGSLR